LRAAADADPESVAQDLGRLVLTVVELVRQLMERQAIRRIDAGDLPEEKIEELGLGLMHLEDAMVHEQISTPRSGSVNLASVGAERVVKRPEHLVMSIGRHMRGFPWPSALSRMFRIRATKSR
jgi:hypothetical protein